MIPRADHDDAGNHGGNLEPVAGEDQAGAGE